MLADEADFGLKRPEVAAQMEHTYELLRHRQNDQGAFGYWGPEKAPKIDFLSRYVMHFLIEAGDVGFDPPVDMFQLGLRNLQRMVSENSNQPARGTNNSLRHLSPNPRRSNNTNYILNLRDQVETQEGQSPNSPPGKPHNRSLPGRRLRPAPKGRRSPGPDRPYNSDPTKPPPAGTTSTPPSAWMPNTSPSCPVTSPTPKRYHPPGFHKITDPIEAGDFNTHSAAYAVLALKAYSHHLQMNPPQLTISESDGTQWRTLDAPGELLKRAQFYGNAKALRFQSAPTVGGPGAYYQTISTGFESGTPNEDIHDGIEVYRQYRNRDGTTAHTVKVGDPVTVVLRVRSLNDREITNVSIVNLLPGGFEVAKSSIEPGQGSCGCDYVDNREDRILLYTTVTPDARTITYQIKPTNQGQFTAPPIFAESMYNRENKSPRPRHNPRSNQSVPQSSFQKSAQNLRSPLICG